MAFPVVQTTATTNGSTASLTATLSPPTGIVSGETLIGILRTAVAGAHGWPAGWTELFDSTADASDDNTSCAWRKATGTEGASIDVSQGNGKYAGIVYRISGATDPTVTPPEFATLVTGTSASPNPGSLTPTGGAKDYLWLWLGGWEGEQTSPPASTPTNYTNALGANSGTGGAITTNVRVASARRSLNAVSEDPPLWTISASDDWTATVVAIHPAPPTPVTITPTGLTSAEAFGTAKEVLTVLGSSLVSAEAFGTAREILTLLGTGLVSGEAFGSTRQVFLFSPGGLASGEVFGTLVIDTGVVTLIPTGIASAEVFGTAREILRILGSSIGSSEVFGTTRQIFVLTPTGLSSTEAFGAAREVLRLLASSFGGEVFGTASIPWVISVTGIGSTEIFGDMQRAKKKLIGEAPDRVGALTLIT